VWDEIIEPLWLFLVDVAEVPIAALECQPTNPPKVTRLT